MMNCGQQCIAPDYVLCHKDALDAFSAAAARYAEQLYLKDCKTNGNFGRIVGLCRVLKWLASSRRSTSGDKQMERLTGLLRSHGGKVVYGGNFDVKDRFIEPTVLLVDKHSPTMVEETFGPILLVSVLAHDACVDACRSSLLRALMRL